MLDDFQRSHLWRVVVMLGHNGRAQYWSMACLQEPKLGSFSLEMSSCTTRKVFRISPEDDRGIPSHSLH